MDSLIRDENPNGSNPTNNTHLNDLIAQNVSRRGLIAGAIGLAAVRFLGGSLLAGSAVAAGPGGRGVETASTSASSGRRLLGFAEVPPSTDDTFVVPPGYSANVIVPWGTPLRSGGPAFQQDASNTAAEQAEQVGFNHDGIFYFGLGRRHERSRRGLLAMNHEYTDADMIYTAAQGSAITPDAAGQEKVQKALNAHGVSVVEVRRQNDGTWTHVEGSPYNRRITGNTPVGFSGPVSADHPMLQSTITPQALGTLNNCGSGITPWGTYLTAEENFNGYFGTDDPAFVRTPLESRYGVSATGFGYNWHKAEARFDVAQNRNEVNRFGWMVEIDPYRPGSTPIKRTALGRFKHEAAACTQSRGRVVVYSGDDENGDYLYKFVGEGRWRQRRACGESPLDHGTLYVARFEADGTGSWLPLVHGEGPLTVANGWVDQADVLIRTRMAADALGATRLHRPEWVTVHPKTKDVYVALTNGSGNGAPVNSGRDPNPYGHVVRFTENRRDNTSLTFAWDIFALAGDPAYDATVPTTQPLFGSPDGLWADDDGRLWIQTDISNSSQNRPERGYNNIGNNQMLAADTYTGEIRRFLTGPRGCEITGVITTPDQRTMFVNVQHPGESTTFWNSQFGSPSTANPSTVSSWPFGGRPRPATVVITKDDGGKIGS